VGSNPTGTATENPRSPGGFLFSGVPLMQLRPTLLRAPLRTSAASSSPALSAIARPTQRLRRPLVSLDWAQGSQGATSVSTGGPDQNSPLLRAAEDSIQRMNVCEPRGGRRLVPRVCPMTASLDVPQASRHERGSSMRHTGLGQGGHSEFNEQRGERRA
jgi:hypothetical protein